MKPLPDICRDCDLPLTSVPAGTILLQEGEQSGALYILETGSVEIAKGDIVLTTVSSPGAVFGELSLLLDTPHMATVRTVAPSTLFFAQDAAGLLDQNLAIYYHLSRLLAARLASVSAYLADIKQQYATNEDHLGMVDEVLECLLHHQTRRRDPHASRR